MAERDPDCRAWYMDTMQAEQIFTSKDPLLEDIVTILSDLNREIRDITVKAHRKIEKRIKDSTN